MCVFHVSTYDMKRFFYGRVLSGDVGAHTTLMSTQNRSRRCFQAGIVDLLSWGSVGSTMHNEDCVRVARFLAIALVS